MTLTIDLTPAEQERVSAAAQESGMNAEQFVKMLVTREWFNWSNRANLPSIDRRHFYFTASNSEFNDALNEVAQMNEHLPVLSDDAFDRETLYM